MKRKFNPFFSVFFLVGLAGCQPGGRGAGNSGCSETLALVDDGSAILSTPPVVPAGGFINIGSRSCTATFLLKSASDASISVSAYSAQHCFKEDSITPEDMSISVHIPGNGSISSGYLKNLKAKDEFFTRRSDFINEVQKLASPAAFTMAKQAVEIALFAQRGIESLDPNKSDEENAATAASDDYQRNVCISSQTDRLSVKESQEVCWSALDSTVRTLDLKRDELGAKQFDTLRSYLELKKNGHDSLLNSSKNISRHFQIWNDRLHGQVGAWRLLNYVNLASFLNKEVCGKYLSKDDANQAICSVRDSMVALVKKHLVEVDIDGKRKSVFDQAQELGFGIESPFIRTEPGSNMVSKANDLYQAKASDRFYTFMNNKISELQKMFPTKGEKIVGLPKQFSIAANPVVTQASSQANAMTFALVDSAALVGASDPVASKGLRTLGILRMYLPNKSTKIKFGPTDSGAMLTFAGVVPLLVVNTVDDKPTSGGSAILALPEPGNQDDAVASVKARGGTVVRVAPASSSDTRVESDGAFVKDKNLACR